MARFAEQPTFGKRNPVSLQELKKMDWDTPDGDGVTRVFSRELWDDPKVGALLREVGFTPDDPRNIRKTTNDYRANFERAKERLDLRVHQTNAEYERRYGYCQLAPFLLIDGPLWEGKYSSFLIAQLDLCPYDEWNVMLLGKDEETIKRCPVLPHIGREPALTAAMEKKLSTLLACYEHGLELFGLTATGQAGGITREMWGGIKSDIQTDLMAYVTNARGVLTDQLERFAADLKAGRIPLDR